MTPEEIMDLLESTQENKMALFATGMLNRLMNEMLSQVDIKFEVEIDHGEMKIHKEDENLPIRKFLCMALAEVIRQEHEKSHDEDYLDDMFYINHQILLNLITKKEENNA